MNHDDLPTRGPQLTDAQRTVIRIMLNAVALILTAGLFESIYLEGFFSAVLAVLILAFINGFIRPL
ncbi:MAG: phage holin family protein, partial [Syntrophobacterales bacterium]